MSSIISRHKQHSHSQTPKKVVLVVTPDTSVNTTDLYERLGFSRKEVSIMLLKTKLTGKRLKKAINDYMQSNEINTRRGDQVVLLNDNGPISTI